jgi:hypothetical protein
MKRPRTPARFIHSTLAVILIATLLATFSEQKIFRIFVSMQNHLKDELHNVLSGKSKVRFGTIIQAISSYLNDGERTSPDVEVQKHFKEQETKRLDFYISQNNLWIDNIDFSQYVSEGAEQKVYLKDSEHVLKLNDAIYYTSWKDYLYNLLLHNYFF